MFGIGFGEMVVIAVFLLIAVGPDKLPTMIKTVAKTYRQFRRAAQDIRASTGIDDLLRDEELRELAELRKQKLLAMSAKAPPAPAAAPASTAAAPASTAVAPASAAAASTVAARSATTASAETSSPTVPGKILAHAPPPRSAEGEGPIPAAPRGAAPNGLTYKQRTMEMPLDGVDVAEAQHAIAHKGTVPATRVSTAFPDANSGDA